jgi:Mg2+ and Co2+ transporter CorA
MCFTIGSFIASIFGMNLKSGLEDDPGMFKLVAGLSCSVLTGAAVLLVFLVPVALGDSAAAV